MHVGEWTLKKVQQCIHVVVAALVLGATSFPAHGFCTDVPSEIAKLLASDAAAGDAFGESVDIDGNWAIVGAHGNSDTPSRGAAYIFEKVGGVWTEVQMLGASDAHPLVHAHFGAAVAIDGNRAVVGANRRPTDVNSGGQVYVYEESGGVWMEVAKFTSADVADGDSFGLRVDIKGNTIAVASDLDDSASTDAGTVYIFREIAGVWTEIEEIIANDPTDHATFGESIALSASGTRLVVGDPFDSDAASQAGAAYIFEEIGGVWTQVDKLFASDASSTDRFGRSVAVSGDTILVGANTAPGTPPSSSSTGAAYVFEKIGGVWTETAILYAADGQTGDNFGYAVALEPGVAVVAATFDKGCPGDPNCAKAGSVTVFCEAGGVWTEIDKFQASDAEAFDEFGFAIGLSGNEIIVGSRLDDDFGSGTGSAYIFELKPSTPMCPADLAGTGGATPDGVVSVFDLLELLANWGTGGPGAAISSAGGGAGIVDVFDLLDLLSAWGPC